MFPELHDAVLAPDSVGRKAFNLHVLARAGLPVPAGFVVGGMVELDLVPDETLAAAVQRIGGFPVAVRSSGVLEDLDGASFAGQYDTELGVAGVAALRAAVARCRASAAGDRVTAYLKQRPLPAGVTAPPLAILVQRMVVPLCSGVAFTVDPITGKEEHARIELCAGLGDRLVGGEVTPTQLVVALETAAVVEEVVGADGARLPARALAELRHLLLLAQARFHRPQDVEWCLDEDERIIILQSRPITRIRWRTDVAELSNAYFKDGGVSARVCAPLMYSLYERPFNAAMQAYTQRIKLLPAHAAPRPWIVSYYGRAYWNAAVVKDLLGRVPGFDEESFDKDLGIVKRYGAGGPKRVPFTVRTVLPALPAALALESAYKKVPGEMAVAMKNFRDAELGWRARAEALPAAPTDEVYRGLERVLLNFQFHAECQYFTTTYVQANFQSDAEAFLRKLGRALGADVDLIKLMSGVADVTHMRLQADVLALYRVAAAHGEASLAFDKALERFLEANYFHSDVELDLTVPRWGEEPGDVRRLVGRLLRSGSEPADPKATAQKAVAAYEGEMARVEALLAKKPLLRAAKLKKFRSTVATMRRYLLLREEMRECSTRAYHVARRYVVEAGRRLTAEGRLEREDDVHFLSATELADLARGRVGGASLLGPLRHRRLLHEGYRDLAPPDEFGHGVEPPAPIVASAASWKGIGASAGSCEGRACVLLSPADAASIQPGDILVTPYTDPAWTPILALVAGVVTEVGGLLSHAAVISREYGIPAVLNVAGATKVITTGQRLHIDGLTGMVTPLGGAAPPVRRAGPAAPEASASA